MTTTRMARLATAAAAVLLLAGCVTGAPAPTPTPTIARPTTNPTATTTPEPTLAVITIHADRVVATDQNGAELGTFPYSTTGPSVVAGFTEWFGFAPSKQEVNRNAPTDAFSGTVYTWDGFSIGWYRGWEDEPGSGASNPPFAAIQASSTVAAVGAVTIQGADGARVGDVVDIASVYSDSHRVLANNDGTEIGQGWSDCVPVDGTSVADAHNCVLVVLSPASGPITMLYAPYPENWGL